MKKLSALLSAVAIAAAFGLGSFSSQSAKWESKSKRWSAETSDFHTYGKRAW